MPERHEVKQCGVCGEILYRSKGGWGHGAEHIVPAHAKDHPAVPVDYDERNLVSRCDFCGLPTANEDRWTLEVGSFKILVEQQGQMVPLFENTGNYMACPICAAYLEPEDWAKLYLHVMDVHPVKYPEVLLMQWEAVREYKLAPIRRWQPGDELSPTTGGT